MNGKTEMIEKPGNVKRLEFRDSRLNKMRSGEALTTLPFDDHPWVILHMIPTVPLESSEIESQFNLHKLAPDMGKLPPELTLFRPIAPTDADIGGEIKDGELIIYARRRTLPTQGNSTGKSDEPEQDSAYSYLRIFRNGTVEAVRATYYSTGKLLLPERFKGELLQAISRYLEILERLGVQPPIAAILTITGIKKGSPKETVTYFPEILIPSFEYRDQSKLTELMEETFNRIPINVIDRSY
jgi:hypothetical protein